MVSRREFERLLDQYADAYAEAVKTSPTSDDLVNKAAAARNALEAAVFG